MKCVFEASVVGVARSNSQIMMMMIMPDQRIYIGAMFVGARSNDKQKEKKQEIYVTNCSGDIMKESSL